MWPWSSKQKHGLSGGHRVAPKAWQLGRAVLLTACLRGRIAVSNQRIHSTRQLLTLPNIRGSIPAHSLESQKLCPDTFRQVSLHHRELINKGQDRQADNCKGASRETAANSS